MIGIDGLVKERKGPKRKPKVHVGSVPGSTSTVGSSVGRGKKDIVDVDADPLTPVVKSPNGATDETRVVHIKVYLNANPWNNHDSLGISTV